MTDSPRSSQPRYHGLDGVRAVAMLLGVVYHALLFGGGMMFMMGGERHGGAILMDWIHSFRMALFFLISGFFSHMMLQKYGLGSYLTKRWWRLGAAMVLYLFVVFGINQWTRGGGGPFEQGPRSGVQVAPASTSPDSQPQGLSDPGRRSSPRSGRPGPGGPGGPGFPAPVSMLAEQIMSQGDRDQSESVSQVEFEELGRRWFALWDADATGKVKQGEFSDRFATVFSQGGPGPGLPGGGPMGFVSRMMAPSVFKGLDSDRDGVLTREEMGSSWLRNFSEWNHSHPIGQGKRRLAEGLSPATRRG